MSFLDTLTSYAKAATSPGVSPSSYQIDPALQARLTAQGASGRLSQLQNPNVTSLTAPVNARPAVPSFTNGYGPTAVAHGTAPVNSTVSIHPPITTPSGATVSPSTGGLISHGSSSPVVGNSSVVPATPTVPPAPNLPPSSTPTDQNNAGATGGNTDNTAGASGTSPAMPNIMSLYNDPAYTTAVKNYENASQLTPDEIQTQTDLNNLQDSARQAYTNAEGQAIPLEFITGQQRVLQNQEANLEQPLTAKLALLQAKRQANLDASKFALDQATSKINTLAELQKPVSMSYGGTLVNPLTGATINGGVFGTGGANATAVNINPATGLPPNASATQILGYLASKGVDVNGRYSQPALINAIQNGVTAEDIISGKANVAGEVANATSKSQLQFNPVTGAPMVFRPTATGASTPTYPGNNTSATAPTASKSTVFSGRNTAATPVATSSGSAAPTTGASIPTPQTKQQAAYVGDLTTGGTATAINSLNTAIGHLFEADQAYNKMGNDNFQFANTLKNKIQTAFGNSSASNYETAQSLASNELAGAYGGNTQGEHEQLAQYGGSNQSPSQHQGYMQTATSLLTSKIGAMVQAYKNAMGQTPSLDLFVSPENQKKLQSIGVDVSKLVPGAAPSRAAAPNAASAGSSQPQQMKLPNGTVVTRQSDGTYK